MFFAGRYGWTAQTIGDMTPAQLTYYLPSGPGGSQGGDILTFNDLRSYSEWAAQHGGKK
jgi:hypothetical protein